MVRFFTNTLAHGPLGNETKKVFITRVDIVNWPPKSDLKADNTMVRGQKAAGINHSG